MLRAAGLLVPAFLLMASNVTAQTRRPVGVGAPAPQAQPTPTPPPAPTPPPPTHPYRPGPWSPFLGPWNAQSWATWGHPFWSAWGHPLYAYPMTTWNLDAPSPPDPSPAPVVRGEAPVGERAAYEQYALKKLEVSRQRVAELRQRASSLQGAERTKLELQISDVDAQLAAASQLLEVVHAADATSWRQQRMALDDALIGVGMALLQAEGPY
ncbi:MAG: hypothetical protein AB2A00_38615 [Myxococcota bacterium]